MASPLNVSMQATAASDSTQRTTDQRSKSSVDMLIAPALATAVSQSSGKTVNSFYTAQSLPSPYIETPPPTPENVGFSDLSRDTPLVAYVLNLIIRRVITESHIRVMGLTGAGKSTVTSFFEYMMTFN